MLIQYLGRDNRLFFAIIIVVVISIVMHELAHGIVAIWRGDNTPIDSGHMTLNPLVHMGPFSLIALFIAGIAWGSMPVDPTRLRGKYAEAMVAAAGPLCNVIIAVVTLGALGLWWRIGGNTGLSQPAENAQFLLEVFGSLNILLAMFNLLPIPPLDGSRILGNFSRRFDETVNSLPMNAPGLYLPLTMVAFIIGGRFLLPLAFSIKNAILAAIVTA